ncbi:MAG: nucleotide sugar dehydrogenase [bacterium]
MLSKNFKPTICVAGLGYVGLPLAYNFARNGAKVCGFDVSAQKISMLKKNIDVCNEISEKKLSQVSIEYSNDPKIIAKANFIIVAVPTPIDKNNKPDLSLVKSASKIVGRNLKKGSIVVFESTVYPGVTEDICMPLLEKNSSLKCGIDFFIGYSPERVNPGDKKHTIDKIIKVVSGMDKKTLDAVAKIYQIACKAGVHKAPNIKTAEAAKVIENIQRDINIALFNEFSLIFDRLNIDTRDVIDAAATKWNFHKYSPGLVGGHCIGVDPYYLVHKALQIGYKPRIITAGRKINNYMAEHVVKKIIEMLKQENKKIANAAIMIMGLTFKENVNDIRNSKAKDIINFLKKYKIKAVGFEPLVDKKIIKNEFGIENADFQKIKNLDGIIVFSPHDEFRKIKIKSLKNKCAKKALFFDIKGFYNKKEVEKEGFNYKRL